jgi:hypothetical protein
LKEYGEFDKCYLCPEGVAIARKIVKELVIIGEEYDRIFCLSYEHLKEIDYI